MDTTYYLVNELFIIYHVIFLHVDHKKDQFFSCNLTTILPRDGPWEKLNQLSSITINDVVIFSEEYLFDEDLWMTLGKINKLR